MINANAIIERGNGYEVVLEGSDPLVILEGSSADEDRWVMDVRGVALLTIEEILGPPPPPARSPPPPPPPPPARAPRAAAHAREGGHRPRAGLRGMAASGRRARGEAAGGSEEDELAAPLDRPGLSHRSAPQLQPNQTGPAALASSPSPAACRPTSNDAMAWVLEMARAGLVTAAELCAAVVQVIVEEKNRRDADPTLSASPTKALPTPKWQTPPGAARTVGVPVKIVRAMINAKRITSRLRNVRPNPKQPKYLVNVRELEAVLARDRDPTREPLCPDNVRELAARIREKASRR